MAIKSPQELFMHELADMYDAEHRILQMLPLLAQESTSDQAKQAFQLHEQETQQQIKNLDQVFQLMGTPPKREACAAVQGLKQEHDSFKKDGPSDQILTMFDLGAAFKTEHYEIASYMGLIEKCQLMGQQKCAQLLQQNLKQEEAMAQRVQQIGKQLGQQAIGTMGQQNQTGTQSGMHTP